MPMQFDLEKNPFDADTVREKILSIIATSTKKITPVALEKELFEAFSLSKKQVKSVIRRLVAEGELAYTYEYGCTFLERSFAKPVRVSKYVVLQPPGHQHRSKSNDVVVQIKPGASFGSGNHPTTRLAIQGIECILLDKQLIDNMNDTNVLDLGTGSGVLLIAAILCGVKSGLGIDTDPCSEVEAAENVKINGLDGRAAISSQSLADIHERFSLILANLRLPTLNTIHLQINEKTQATSYLVFSGIRDYELDGLLQVYEKIQFKKIWSRDELGWSAVVLQRRK